MYKLPSFADLEKRESSVKLDQSEYHLKKVIKGQDVQFGATSLLSYDDSYIMCVRGLWSKY